MVSFSLQLVLIAQPLGLALSDQNPFPIYMHKYVYTYNHCKGGPILYTKRELLKCHVQNNINTAIVRYQ